MHPLQKLMFEGTQVQWYVTFEEKADLHLHIYPLTRNPLKLHEERSLQNIRDFPAVNASQLESYIRLSLGDVHAPIDETSTRDEYHYTYKYTPETYSLIAFVMDNCMG